MRMTGHHRRHRMSISISIIMNFILILLLGMIMFMIMMTNMFTERCGVSCFRQTRTAHHHPATTAHNY